MDPRRGRRSTILTRSLPAIPDLAHTPTRTEQRQLAAAPEMGTPKLPEHTGRRLPSPLPTDPTVLADALAPPILKGKAEYPRVLTAQVAGLAASRYLTRAERATALRVLALIPGITYEGATTDITGRPGLTVTVTADTTTRLVIDPHTGELLAAHEYSTHGPRPGLWSYLLILERTRQAPAPPN